MAPARRLKITDIFKITRLTELLKNIDSICPATITLTLIDLQKITSFQKKKNSN